MQRSDSQIIAMGTFTKELLSSDAFCELYKEYTDQSLANIVSSQPHEVKVREFEYAKLQAVAGFVSHMAGLAEAAQTIINNSTQPSSDED